MRFMMLMRPKARGSAPPGTPPDARAAAAMAKYNESLRKAGVLLAFDELHPPALAARVSFHGGTPQVADGPFADATEAPRSCWMLQARSRDEAIAWASRCPARDDDVIEVRQVQDPADRPAPMRAAAPPRGEG
jgi:hypothetical protein